MKKNGFTLAEVLITLAIIGVVATLTLPALLNNTQEQQARTALKKGINTLTEAAQMNAAIDGFDYSTFGSTDTDDSEKQSLYALLAKRTSMNYTLSKVGSDLPIKAGAGKVAATNFTVFFRDGSAMSYDPASTTAANATGNNQSDGIAYGIPVLFDTNGMKGPNVLSNCKGEAKTATEDNKGGTCAKKDRVIRDQFGIRLRGSIAVPNGQAARWVLEN